MSLLAGWLVGLDLVRDWCGVIWNLEQLQMDVFYDELNNIHIPYRSIFQTWFVILGHVNNILTPLRGDTEEN
jgi:hypothetical protein